jgi:hypothetical protein
MKPVTTINRLVVVPGSMDAFIEAQRTFAAGLAKSHDHLLGGRMYRALDSKTAVLVSLFRSREAQEEVFRLEEFKRHLARLQPMVESSSPALYDVAYGYGELG